MDCYRFGFVGVVGMLKPLSASGAEPLMVLAAGGGVVFSGGLLASTGGAGGGGGRPLLLSELPKCCAEC